MPSAKKVNLNSQDLLFSTESKFSVSIILPFDDAEQVDDVEVGGFIIRCLSTSKFLSWMAETTYKPEAIDMYFYSYTCSFYLILILQSKVDNAFLVMEMEAKGLPIQPPRPPRSLYIL